MNTRYLENDKNVKRELDYVWMLLIGTQMMVKALK